MFTSSCVHAFVLEKTVMQDSTLSVIHKKLIYFLTKIQTHYDIFSKLNEQGHGLLNPLFNLHLQYGFFAHLVSVVTITETWTNNWHLRELNKQGNVSKGDAQTDKEISVYKIDLNKILGKMVGLYWSRILKKKPWKHSHRIYNVENMYRKNAICLLGI